MSCRRGEILTVEFCFSTHLVRGHYRVNLNIRNPLQAAFCFAAENVAHFAVDEDRSYDGVVEINPRFTLIKNGIKDNAGPGELLRTSTH